MGVTQASHRLMLMLDQTGPEQLSVTDLDKGARHHFFSRLLKPKVFSLTFMIFPVASAGDTC